MFAWSWNLTRKGLLAVSAGMALVAVASAQTPSPARLPEPIEAPTSRDATPETVPPPRPEGKDAPAIAEDKASQKCEAPPSPSPFAKVPPVVPLPRPGNFGVLPQEGYFTLRDQIEGKWLGDRPRFPFGFTSINPQSSFDYDWRFLEKPGNTEYDWSDFYKRIYLGSDWMASTGGEFRFRAVHENDTRLDGRKNNYDLTRLRVYGDLWYRDEFRVFVEGIDARSFNQDLPPLVIDRTGSDLLNAFVEAKVGEELEGPIYLRLGRQELCYGSQRLISTLDWANTRRTFQGAKGYWHTDKLDIDAFWVQPVIPDPNKFDSVDDNRDFFGTWLTYRPRKGTALDLYYLGLNSSLDASRGVTNTGGFRYAGDTYDTRLLFDVEGMCQWGEHLTKHIAAQAGTLGLGWNFCSAPWKPVVWAYYDYASGDPNPDGTGNYRTFNQLFPFGHYYFGFIDDVGRQNIHDANFHLYLYPEAWIIVNVQYHIFNLDKAKDALYNAAGAPIRRDPTGRAGTDVGTEIDFTVNFHLTTHQDLFLGYSRLNSGPFIKNTGNPLSPELFYVQYSFRW
jgi:hypothetical protein